MANRNMLPANEHPFYAIGTSNNRPQALNLSLEQLFLPAVNKW